MTRACLAAWLCVVVAVPASSSEKPRVAIVTGQNNHAWYVVAPAIEAILDESGLFDVDVVVTPSARAEDSAWDDFAIAFDDYAVVYVNYNGGTRPGDKRDGWPPRVKAAFERYVEAGGRVCLHHAANNAFAGWAEYERMAGLLWRKAGYGERIYYDDAGEPVRVPAGEGPSAGHGPRHAFVVTAREPGHPIFAGMPARWRHAADELYHGQRGPAKGMTILATAYSSPDRKGTGVHEPMVWTVPYGRGLVLTNLMGHVWPASSGDDDLTPLRCVGYRTLLVRSIEWLATGEVTTPVPDDFPGPDRPVFVGPIDVEPLPR